MKKLNKEKTNHFEAIARGLDTISLMGPSYLQIKEIHQKLLNKGYEVSEKTVTRDLKTLSNLFPQHIFMQDESRPYGFKLPEGSKKISGMSPDEAICLQLAYQYLNPLLPNRTLEPIAPYLKEAETVLNMNASKRMRNWKKKVLTIHEGFNLQPAKIKKEIMPILHSALWNGSMIRATYKSAASQTAKKYLLHPVGIVHRGRVSYLICSFENHIENFSYLPLHRFSSMTKLTEYSAHKGKDVKEVAEIVGFPVSAKKMKVKLKFSKSSGGHAPGNHLKESPISKNQKITETNDGFLIVEDEVDDILEFRWWIRAFGDTVEVIKPKSLRDEFAEMSKRMSSQYE